MSYLEHKRDWERLRAEFHTPAPKGHNSHKVTSKDLVEELKLLARLTKDDRFSDALLAMSDHGLVDESGSWVRHWRARTNPVDSQRYARVIDELMSAGRSLRESCAMMVADTGLHHATFEAGVAHFERLYRRGKAEGCDSK